MLKIEDLIEGEIYYHKTFYEYIFQYTFYSSTNVGYQDYIDIKGRNFFKKRANSHNNIDNSIIKIATSEQKHWFLECQKANKFIPYEEAMKTFKAEEQIPEYVEYIDTEYKGIIVKVEFWGSGSYCRVIFTDGQKEQPFKHLVKNSTKEAYDLQNSKTNIQFEVGKWYKNTNTISYRKCSETGDKLKYNEAIFCDIDKGWEKCKGFAFWKCVSLLTDLSEIQQYLPDGHPDEFLKSEKKYKYEVVHSTQNKKVDGISPVKVNTKLLDIIKIKGSAPTKVEKKRIKLTILKTKQLNLN